MKGIILAGGLGTRLRPLTSVTNKHLLPVGRKPMIQYPIEMLVEAGLRELLVVIGGQSTEAIVKLLKDGRDYGLRRLYYVYQEGEGGIAAALSLAEEWVNGDTMVVALGDNLLLGESLKEPIQEFARSGRGCCLFLKAVEKPEQCGVAEFDVRGRLLQIVEKPDKPPSYMAVTGIYLYDNTVFEKIQNCRGSKRGELEITDVNNQYIQEGRAQYRILTGWWGDAGESIEALIRTGQKALEWDAQQVEEYPELLAKG